MKITIEASQEDVLLVMNAILDEWQCFVSEGETDLGDGVARIWNQFADQIPGSGSYRTPILTPVRE